jgi:hypothetical protein
MRHRHIARCGRGRGRGILLKQTSKDRCGWVGQYQRYQSSKYMVAFESVGLGVCRYDCFCRWGKHFLLYAIRYELIPEIGFHA